MCARAHVCKPSATTRKRGSGFVGFYLQRTDNHYIILSLADICFQSVKLIRAAVSIVVVLAHFLTVSVTSCISVSPHESAGFSVLIGESGQGYLKMTTFFFFTYRWKEYMGY